MRYKSAYLILASAFVMLIGCGSPQQSTIPNKQTTRVPKQTVGMVNESSVPELNKSNSHVTTSPDNDSKNSNRSKPEKVDTVTDLPEQDDQNNKQIYSYHPSHSLPEGIRSNDIAIKEIVVKNRSYLEVTALSDSSRVAFIGSQKGGTWSGIYIPDSPGSEDLHIRIDPQIGHTTLAGLSFHDECVISIAKNGIVVVNREGIYAKGSFDTLYISKTRNIDGKQVIVLIRSKVLGNEFYPDRSSTKGTASPQKQYPGGVHMEVGLKRGNKVWVHLLEGE